MSNKNASASGSAPAPARQAMVVVVDDDQGLRESLGSLFGSVDLPTLLFGSPSEMLAETLPDVCGCIVLDVRLPGVSGLDFQEQLRRRNIRLPIIFMTGHGDVPMSVRAMKAGAVDFLSKPFRDQDMLDAVMTAIALDAERRRQAEAMRRVSTLYETLSAREKTIMEHVTAGLMNKQVATLLNLSEITIKIHRGQVMRKMGATSLPDLVRMAELLKVAAQAVDDDRAS